MRKMEDGRRVAALVAVGVPPLYQGQELGKLLPPPTIKSIDEALSKPRLVFAYSRDIDEAYQLTSAIIELYHSQLRMVNQIGLRSLFRHRMRRDRAVDQLDKLLRDPEILSLTSLEAAVLDEADSRDVRWLWESIKARYVCGKSTLFATNLPKKSLSLVMTHHGLAMPFEAALVVKVGAHG